MRARHSLLSLLPLLLLLVAPRALLAQDAPPRLAVTAGISGELTTIVCQRPPQPAFVRVAGALASSYAAVAVDSGGLLSSSASSSMAERDPEQLAETVASLGYRALSMSRADLAAHRGRRLATAAALAQRQAPYVLSNLRCTAPGQALCDVVRDATDEPVVLEVAGERLGFVSVLHPSALTTVARDRSVGLALGPAVEGITNAVRRAREAGASRVVAVYQPERGNELANTAAVAGALRGDGAPDLLLVNNFEELFGEGRTPSGVLVRATRRGRVLLVPLQNHLEEATLAPEQGAPPDAAVRLSEGLRDAFCQHAGQSLRGAVLERPMGINDFISLTLDVLRERTRGEVALINRRAFDDARQFPLIGAVTRLAVTAALPFDNELRLTRMRGSLLRTVVTRALRNPDFAVRGAALEGTTLRVNGRVIDDTLDYTVVATDFIADGGEGGLGEGTATLHWWPTGRQNVREVLLQWLEQQRQGDAREAPQDPALRTRWSFRAMTDLSFSAVLISNDPLTPLTDSQLARAQTLILRGELEVHADADHPNYTWENSVRLRYGTVNTLTDAMGVPQTGGFQSNTDLIAARSTGVLREWVHGHPRPWQPLPYGELFLESEFNPPPTRAYRHLLLRPTIGARWQLWDRLSLQLATGFESELLARRDQLMPLGSSPTAWSVVAGWTLTPGPLFSLGSRVIEGETTGEFTLRDVVSHPQLLARVRARISVPLFDILSLTVNWDLFVRYARFPPAAGQPDRDVWGVSNDITVGLRLQFARAFQGFAF